MSIPTPISSRSVSALAPMLAAVLMLAGGCQSYHAEPLDLTAHQRAFLARMPDAGELTASIALRAETSHSQGLDFDLSDGITLEEAEAVALVYNADLRMARLRAGVTRAGADNAGLWNDPTVGVDLTRIIQNTPYPWKVFSSIGLTIPISGRLEIEKQRASLEHAAELARAAESEWRTRVHLRRAWAEWSALDERSASTDEFLERIGQVVSIVDAMERAGELARTEARLFKVEKSAMAAEQQLLRVQTAEAVLSLKQLMGLSPTAPVTLVPRQPAGVSTPSDLANLELWNSSPLMLVAIAEYEVSERSLELAIRKQYPDLQIGPGYGYEDGQDEILLGISVPLPILNANRREIAEADASRTLARANAETVMEGLLAEYAMTAVRLEAATARREAIENELVPLVNAQYADARQLATLGEVNTNVLLQTLTRQQDALGSLIDARRDEALAAIRLQEIAGPTSQLSQEAQP